MKIKLPHMRGMKGDSKQDKTESQATGSGEQKSVATNAEECICMSALKALGNATFQHTKHACCSTEQRGLNP